MTDALPPHEWPTGSGLRAPMEPDPTPLHEPEPGLLDEEILPIEADWWRGPFYTDGGSGIGVDGVIACLREYLARARKKAQIIGTIT